MCSSQLDSKDPMHPLRFGAWMAAENLATKNKLKKEFVELFGPAVGAGFFHSRDLGLFLLLHQWGYIYLNSKLFKWLKITVLALHSYTN